MSVKIIKTILPSESNINALINNIDYIDSFSANCTSNVQLNPMAVTKAFFKCSPKWVIWLLKLRDKIVKPLKLKGTNYNALLQQLQTLEPKIGRKIGDQLVISSISSQELILEQKDAHLNLAISFFISKKETKQTITLSTAVKFNNKLGKVYFFTIKPFHKLLAKVTLRNIINHFQTQ